MDYQRIYDALIANRQQNIPLGYTEKHHIQMWSLGGSDDEANLVKLTAREHYIAHLLLAKFSKCQQTALALWMMQMKPCEESGRPSIKSSRMYEWARKEFAKYISRNNKIASKGERNSQHGTRWICNVDLKENRKISKTNELPQGWILGRNKWPREFCCKKCNAIFYSHTKKRLYCSSQCEPTTLGLKFTLETKIKMSNIKKELYKDPTKNPMYGRNKRTLV